MTPSGFVIHLLITMMIIQNGKPNDLIGKEESCLRQEKQYFFLLLQVAFQNIATWFSPGLINHSLKAEPCSHIERSKADYSMLHMYLFLKQNRPYHNSGKPGY